jgi:hypothetical protein
MKMNRKLFIVRLATTLGIAALTTSSALAQSYPEAAEGSEPAEISAASAGMHCVAELAPVSEGASESTVGMGSCYKTFAAAMAAATDNTVVLSPDASPQSVREADLAAAATRVIGIDYNGINGTGRSQTWFVRNAFGCRGGRSYKANMPNSFNNLLSSTSGFNGCRRNTSYDLRNQSGDWVRCFSACSYIGGFLDNRTSSKRWQN